MQAMTPYFTLHASRITHHVSRFPLHVSRFPRCRAVIVLLAIALWAAGARAADLARLRVGTSGDYAPFSARAAAGEPSGFDIDLATRLAHDLGRTAEFVSFRWPELQNEMRAARFDLAAS